jgi:hypothetical protein
MTGFKEKAQIFVIGVSIGLLVAGAFFILKLDDYFKELSLYKKVAQTLVPVKNTLISESDSHREQEKKVPVKIANKSAAVPDTFKFNETPLVPDTTKLITGDSLNSLFVAGDDIVVKKDELLSTKTVEVINMNPVADRPAAKDSLLEKVSGVKDDRIAGKQMFNLEFWQSPLNYKGYRMSKYKIVLYGIPSSDGLKLYKLEDVIYMKLGSNVYKLDYESNFKQYDRITDEQITNKLK